MPFRLQKTSNVTTNSKEVRNEEKSMLDLLVEQMVSIGKKIVPTQPSSMASLPSSMTSILQGQYNNTNTTNTLNRGQINQGVNFITSDNSNQGLQNNRMHNPALQTTALQTSTNMYVPSFGNAMDIPSSFNQTTAQMVSPANTNFQSNILKTSIPPPIPPPIAPLALAPQTQGKEKERINYLETLANKLAVDILKQMPPGSNSGPSPTVQGSSNLPTIQSHPTATNPLNVPAHPTMTQPFRMDNTQIRPLMNIQINPSLQQAPRPPMMQQNVQRWQRPPHFPFN